MELLKNTDYKNIKELYKTAFPKNERPSFLFLKRATRASEGAFWSLMDNGFKGFCSTIIYQDVCYIFFLAINEDTRGKGYGSYMLKEIKTIYKDYKICLSIEPLIKGTTNYDQRVRRKSFYNKNGFKYWGLKSFEPAGAFELLADQPITKAELIGVYKTILGELLYKILKIKVVKAKGEN